MGKILFVARNSVGATIPPEWSNLITNIGYTADVITSSNINNIDLSAYDLAVFNIFIGTTTESLDAIKKCLSVGLDCLYCVMENGADTTGSIAFNLGISSSPEMELSSGPTNIVTFGNNILKKSNGLEFGTSLSIRSSASYFDYIDTISAVAFKAIAANPSNLSQICLGVLPKGSTTSKIANTGANLWFSGTFYVPSGQFFTETAGNIILDIIAYSAPIAYKITGTVSDSNNQPLQRLLRAFDQSSGDLVAETTSASDGSYRLSTSSSDPVTVVCYHDASDTNNSQVKDDLVPILDE